jgi:peptidyl-prolyl cis-trans isomerase SurA
MVLVEGDVSPVMRSPGGFHIVKLNDVRSRNAPTVVEQSHVRHILVRVNEATSESEAKAKVDRIKDRIETGAKFADSQAQFEDAPRQGRCGACGRRRHCPSPSRRTSLVNEISACARLGWHLILVESATQDVTRSAGATKRAAPSGRAADEEPRSSCARC